MILGCVANVPMIPTVAARLGATGKAASSAFAFVAMGHGQVPLVDYVLPSLFALATGLASSAGCEVHA